jgi:Ca2+:H+ antiporter
MASEGEPSPFNGGLDVENGLLDNVVLKPWDRFRRKGKKNVGVWKSIYNIYTCSCECHRGCIGGCMLSL